MGDSVNTLPPAMVTRLVPVDNAPPIPGSFGGPGVVKDIAESGGEVSTEFDDASSTTSSVRRTRRDAEVAVAKTLQRRADLVKQNEDATHQAEMRRLEEEHQRQRPPVEVRPAPCRAAGLRTALARTP